MLSQVFARESSGRRRASPPVAFTVHLSDVNDNAPVLAPVADVTLAAGSDRRVVARLSASDADDPREPVRYRLLRASPHGGRGKFAVDRATGAVSVVGPVRAGERYSLTFSAEDSGGRASQPAVVEVRVADGPNLRGPVFGQFLYQAEVSEGASKFAEVATAAARDPEGGPVRYSLVAGDPEGHFSVEESTGVVRVMRPLDRETQRRYSLVSLNLIFF